MSRALRCHAQQAAPPGTDESTPAAAVEYYVRRGGVKGAQWLCVEAPEGVKRVSDVVRLACEPHSPVDTARVFLVRPAGLRPTVEEEREAARKLNLRLDARLRDAAPPGSWLLVRQPDADRC